MQDLRKSHLHIHGGCDIGSRPIDLHLKALRKLGISIDENSGVIKCKCEKITGAKIKISDDIEDVKGSDVIYTDVWISMGEEKESVQRHKAFVKYQVNEDLLKKANKNCIVLHCLPAVRGEEISATVMAKQEPNIFEEAENRLHIHKAVILFLLK